MYDTCVNWRVALPDKSKLYPFRFFSHTNAKIYCDIFFLRIYGIRALLRNVIQFQPHEIHRV